MGNNSITFILFFGTDQHQIRSSNDNDLFKRKQRRRKIDSNYLQCDPPLSNINFLYRLYTVIIIIMIMIIIINRKWPSSAATTLQRTPSMATIHTYIVRVARIFHIFCISYLVVVYYTLQPATHINLGLTRRCGEIGEPPVSP